ncbi:hypothetical protein TNIN_177491 [Trichonephila inaurata madagascariensis]|uniref:Uncharacterized protein n=1 Tax=Trichonephila inaurata madagascariensis TaxID=2747483 RepID=A0A8X6YNC5_9ARAC|nr:hypothetical protein TNIN_177491 [Trichonephila inaurata madagascariensis]
MFLCQFSLVELKSSSCPTNSIQSDDSLQSNPVDENENNDLHLSEEEGYFSQIKEKIEKIVEKHSHTNHVDKVLTIKLMI